MPEQLTCCPKCGSDDGWHYRLIVRVREYHNWDGSSDGSDPGRTVRGGQARYCNDCDAYIGPHNQDTEDQDNA